MKLVKKHIILLFLTVITYSVSGQSESLKKKIDSLIFLTEKTTGIEKAKHLVILGIMYFETDSSKYFQYLNIADKIYLAENDSKGQIEVLFRKGYYYASWVDFELASAFFHKAKDVSGKEKLFPQLGKMCYWLGMNNRRAAQYDSAFIYFTKSKDIYAKLINPVGQGMALQGIGSTYFSIGVFDSAIHNFNNSIKYFYEGDALSEVARSLYYSSICYYKLGRYDSTVQQIFRVIPIFKQYNFTSDIWNSYDILGNAFFKLKNFDDAILYYKLGLEIKENFSLSRPDINNRLPQAYSYNNIARVLNETGEYKEALQYALKSLHIKLKEGSKNDLATSYNYLGRIYKSLNISDSALYFSEKALILFNEEDNKPGQIEVLINLSEIYKSKGEIHKANYLLIDALSISQQIGSMSLIEKCAGLLSKQYEELNDFPNAFKYYKIQSLFKDSIFNKDSQTIISELQTKYKTLEKEKELQLQKEMLQRKRIQFNSLLIGGISLIFFSIIVIFLKHKTRRQKEKILLKEKEGLQKELELNNRDLVCNVSKIYTKNQVINKVARTLTKSTDSFKKANMGMIKDIIGELKQNIDETSWVEFETRFAKVHGSFYKSLDQKYPELTQSERKLCAMLKLGMSSKEIAAITITSSKSVDTSRSRLRKKLGLRNDESLFNFLNSL